MVSADLNLNQTSVLSTTAQKARLLASPGGAWMRLTLMRSSPAISGGTQSHQFRLRIDDAQFLMAPPGRHGFGRARRFAVEEMQNDLRRQADKDRHDDGMHGDFFHLREQMAQLGQKARFLRRQTVIADGARERQHVEGQLFREDRIVQFFGDEELTHLLIELVHAVFAEMAGGQEELRVNRVGQGGQRFDQLGGHDGGGRGLHNEQAVFGRQLGVGVGQEMAGQIEHAAVFIQMMVGDVDESRFRFGHDELRLQPLGQER